ncbi:MAG: polysaccharide deacetylase family protein [Xanthomonadaceae bacterium]|nr:polysaccharide deacetylase family protein [Xanthomonadaceae bacterium]
MNLLVSIHDVMPTTLAKSRRIFERLNAAGLSPVTLLVVPGKDWRCCDLDQLRAMVDAGAQLAGHGWTHQAGQLRGLRHRLHSALISRRAGEHLALSRREILKLMLRNHRWFAKNGLPEPGLYVPPAWAMGPVSRELLDRLPFRQYETLAGVYHSTCRRFDYLPVVGFEADTAFRAVAVGALNRLNRIGARVGQRPLRLAIHPDDFELKLADDLVQMIEVGGRALGYGALAPDW